MLTHTHLKMRQRAERENHGEGIALRIHRALSWLNRSELCDDEDGRFIFLWIAFNAAYANDLGDMRMAESRLLGEFLQRLSRLDGQDRLSGLAWRRYPSAIRLLLSNRYVFQPYWVHQNGFSGSDDWAARFASAKRAANTALANGYRHRIEHRLSAPLYTAQPADPRRRDLERRREPGPAA